VQPAVSNIEEFAIKAMLFLSVFVTIMFRWAAGTFNLAADLGEDRTPDLLTTLNLFKTLF